METLWGQISEYPKLHRLFITGKRLRTGSYHPSGVAGKTGVIDTSTITRGLYADISGIKREYDIKIPHPKQVIEYLQENLDLVDILWKIF